jgi:hypothetical protein
MPEHHMPSREEVNMVATAVHHQTLEALYGVIKGKGICAGCYSDAIMMGMADAFAHLIVQTKDAPEVDAIADEIADRIVEHVEFLLGQGHHAAGSHHDN